MTMRYAVVTTNVLDLWAEPRADSERASQLLFAEPVRVLGSRQGFMEVEQPDGYRGWVDERFIGTASDRAFADWRNKSRFAVKSLQASVYASPGRSSRPPHVLYYGTLLTGRSTGGYLRIALAPCDPVYVKQSALRPKRHRMDHGLTGATIVKEALRFLGVPYLWGGITVTGFDCSGFVRTVFSTFGVFLPRDTKDQITVGTPVTRAEVRTGDLLFFERHVGIAFGRDRLVHASRGGGGVRLESLQRGRPDYRPDLDRSFREARRILPCT